MNSPNEYYIGNTHYDLSDSKSKNLEKLQLRIKNLLMLKNVNFLIGNGTSIDLGAPRIASFQNWWNDERKALNISESYEKGKELLTSICEYEVDGEKWDDNLESLLSYLANIYHNTKSQLINTDKITIAGKEFSYNDIQNTIILIKSLLYHECKLITQSKEFDENQVHKDFLRKILLRPVTLPRVKLFTTNYDLALEKYMDEMGITYLDGFTGSIEKRFRPESYQYDLYYPGETTEGIVSRIDKVLHLYKLHGSINWARKESSENIFGILQKELEEDEIGDLMIYPTALKEGETLGYPYSELFRYFSFSIFRPQSVLFTIGYSFGDDHINRLIYQALSIPTFNLVIVIPEGKSKLENGQLNETIERIIDKVNSKRIIVICGGQSTENGKLEGFGTFQDFVKKVLPDMEDMKTEEKIREELKKLYDENEMEEKESISKLKKVWNAIRS